MREIPVRLHPTEVNSPNTHNLQIHQHARRLSRCQLNIILSPDGQRGRVYVCAQCACVSRGRVGADARSALQQRIPEKGCGCGCRALGSQHIERAGTWSFGKNNLDVAAAAADYRVLDGDEGEIEDRYTPV